MSEKREQSVTECHDGVATRRLLPQEMVCNADAAVRGGRMIGMGELQQITYNGRLAAVVVADQAIIFEELAEDEERTVMAMCLYALEVAAGRERGPYSDERALQYARRAQREAPQ